MSTKRGRSIDTSGVPPEPSEMDRAMNRVHSATECLACGVEGVRTSCTYNWPCGHMYCSRCTSTQLMDESAQENAGDDYECDYDACLECMAPVTRRLTKQQFAINVQTAMNPIEVTDAPQRPMIICPACKDPAMELFCSAQLCTGCVCDNCRVTDVKRDTPVCFNQQRQHEDEQQQQQQPMEVDDDKGKEEMIEVLDIPERVPKDWLCAKCHEDKTAEIPTLTFDDLKNFDGSDPDDWTCPVCMNHYDNKEYLPIKLTRGADVPFNGYNHDVRRRQVPGCGHNTCEKCFLKLTSTHQNCPLCRKGFFGGDPDVDLLNEMYRYAEPGAYMFMTGQYNTTSFQQLPLIESNKKLTDSVAPLTEENKRLKRYEQSSDRYERECTKWKNDRERVNSELKNIQSTLTTQIEHGKKLKEELTNVNKVRREASFYSKKLFSLRPSR